MPDILALELKFNITQYVQDRDVLQALTAVSKAWNRAAQVVLFRTLSLHIGTKTGRKKVSDFITFLQNSPHIRPLICTLRLVGFREGLSFLTELPTLEVSRIFTLITLLPNVRELAVRLLAIPGPLDPLDLDDTTYLHRPCKLSLWSLCIDEIAFHILLTRLTGSTLSVSSMQFNQPDDASEIAPPFPDDVLDSVRSLTLGHDDLYWSNFRAEPGETFNVEDLAPNWPNLISYAPSNLVSFGASCALDMPGEILTLVEFLKSECRWLDDLRLTLIPTVFGDGIDAEHVGTYF